MKKMLSLLFMLSFLFTSAQQKLKFNIPITNGASVDYEGTVVNGRANGYGKGKLTNGNIYEGNWKDNNWDGKGKLINKEGSIYEGDFIDGKLTGNCKYTFADGRKYEGGVLDFKWHGTGTFYYKDGALYVGDWVNGKQTGNCEYTFADGRKYIGGVLDGSWHGKGKFIYKSGDIYDGEWVKGKRQGRGWYKGVNGYEYYGEYSNGQEHGLGKRITNSGEYQEGLFDSTKGYLRKGKIWFPQGIYYEGMLDVNGSYNGYGKEITKNGTVSEGKWDWVEDDWDEEIKLVEKLSKAEYEKKYGSVNMPELPDWIKQFNMIDTTDYVTRQYLLPNTSLGKFIDLYGSNGLSALSFIANRKEAKLKRLYVFDDATTKILFNATGMFKYNLQFNKEEIRIAGYTKKASSTAAWLDYSTTVTLLKIPAANQTHEWEIVLDGKKYACKSENTKIKMGPLMKECILLTQTADGFARKYYLIKGKGLYRVEDGTGKLLGQMK